MANIYYKHHSVKNSEEASIFGNDFTWTIPDILRSADTQRLTAQQIHQKVEKKLHTKFSRSKTYGLLKRLSQEKWIHRYYESEVQAQVHVAAVEWGGIDIEEGFDKTIIKYESEYLKQKLFSEFLNFLQKTTNDLSENHNTQKYLPELDNVCKKCGKNH